MLLCRKNRKITLPIFVGDIVTCHIFSNKNEGFAGVHGIIQRKREDLTWEIISGVE